MSEIEKLRDELLLVIGIACGSALKHQDYDTLRLLIDTRLAKEIAESFPDGMMAALRKKYH